MEDICLEVRVRREIDSGERYIAEQARSGAPVKTEDTQLADNVHCTPRCVTFQFGRLTLYLQTNFAKRCFEELDS